jgi:hypothetical protein
MMKHERIHTEHEKFQLLFQQVRIVFPRLHTEYLNKLDTSTPLDLKSR